MSVEILLNGGGWQKGGADSVDLGAHITNLYEWCADASEEAVFADFPVCSSAVGIGTLRNLVAGTNSFPVNIVLVCPPGKSLFTVAALPAKFAKRDGVPNHIKILGTAVRVATGRATSHASIGLLTFTFTSEVRTLDGVQKRKNDDRPVEAARAAADLPPSGQEDNDAKSEAPRVR